MRQLLATAHSGLPVVRGWAVVAASTLALAACGGGNGGDDASPGDASPGDDAGATAPSEELPEITINVGHVVSATEPTHLVLEEIAAAVSERSGGRLTLELFPEGQLGQNRDMQEQVLSGAPQIAQVDPGYAAEAGGVPEMNVLGGPFLFEDIGDVEAVLESDLMQEWTGDLATEGGLHSITWNFFFGERHIIANEGYPQPEDLEGVKIRVPPNPSWIATFEALNTEPVTLEFSEVYTGMQQGVIEAAEAPLSTLKGTSLHEVGDTITLTGHFKAITGWATSVEFWDSLPPEYQEILTEEFAAGAQTMTETTLEQEDVLRAEFEEELGVTLVEPDIDAYREAALPFYDAFPEFREGLHDQLLEIMKD